MTITEIIILARRMRDTMRDGLRRAAHYLRAVGLSIEFALWALRFEEK